MRNARCCSKVSRTSVRFGLCREGNAEQPEQATHLHQSQRGEGLRDANLRLRQRSHRGRDGLTQRIKRCQKLLEVIKNESRVETSAHAKVCSTVSFRLAHDIQEATKQLRQQQKSFVEQRKQFEFSEKPTFLDLAVDEALNMGSGFDELVEDDVMRDLEERNEEIRKIVDSIYELSDIYKELAEMVVYQGSLLDRVD
jgi:hypothetical protein